MGRAAKEREKREKREKDADFQLSSEAIKSLNQGLSESGKPIWYVHLDDEKVVVEPLRYIVKADLWESEVLVEGGRVMTADDPLEDYVGDPWDALADHARAHGWKVRDKAAQAGEPPKLSKISDPMRVFDEGANIPMNQIQLKPPRIGDLSGVSQHIVTASGIGANPTTDLNWQTPLNDIEKKMRTAAAQQAEKDEEMKRLVQEYAVRQAQNGNIDAMNAAIFPQPTSAFTKEQERELGKYILREVISRLDALMPTIVAEVARYLGMPGDQARAKFEERKRMEIERRANNVDWGMFTGRTSGPGEPKERW